MERSGDQLLAGAGFAQNENRRVRRRHRFDLTERLLENAALPNDFFKILLSADLVLKVKFLFLQPRLRFGRLTMFQSVVDSDGDLVRNLGKEVAIALRKSKLALSAKA